MNAVRIQNGGFSLTKGILLIAPGDVARRSNRCGDPEFDGVAVAFAEVAARQSRLDQADILSIVAILEKRRTPVRAKTSAGCFVPPWFIQRIARVERAGSQTAIGSPRIPGDSPATRRQDTRYRRTIR
jgi:hypothetical protein